MKGKHEVSPVIEICTNDFQRLGGRHILGRENHLERIAIFGLLTTNSTSVNRHEIEGR